MSVEPTDPRDAATDPGVKASVAAALFGADATIEFPTIGRFRITGELGRGGMGRVLAGFDDQLERRVAIKLLKSSLREEHRVRLEREAKALAKLNHPNVVHVYEVGSHEGRLFIAMEYVVGRTLRRWIAEESPSVDAVLAVFIAAGRGLATAHAQGLVHRDFKPDNVLVGDDGRPRVLDFGLARGSGPKGTAATPLRPPGEEVSAQSGLDATLTSAGSILGTPAYMPAEQLTGAGTSPASDQFSFCVALFEALYGVRPFRGDTLQALTMAVTGGELTVPSRPRGPGSLKKIVERGLAREPSARWPDMDALLRALEGVRTAPQRRRRRAFTLGALAITTTATTWAVVGGTSQGPAAATTSGAPSAASDDPCPPVEAWFEGIWDDETKAELDAKFRGAPARAQAWWGFETRLLDGWARTWTEIYERSCSGELEQDRPRFERRKTCLEQRMIEIRTRVRLLQELRPEARADAAVIDYFPFYLPAECEDERTLLSLSLFPADPAERTEVIDALVQMRVGEARVQAATVGAMPAEHEAAMKEALEVIPRIESTGFEPAIAELRVRFGNGLLVSGLGAQQGFAALEQGIALARRTRDDRIRVSAELWRLRHAANRGLRSYDAPEVGADLDAWEIAVESVGAPANALITLLIMRGRHHATRGESEDVGPQLERAVSTAESAYGEDSMFTLMTLHKVANVYAIAGLDAESERARSRAIAITERLFGSDAAQLGFMLRHDVEHALRRGRLDDAEAAARRLTAVVRAHHQVGSVIDFEAQIVLARVLMAQRRYGEVDALLRALDPLAADLHGGPADRWALVRLIHLALAGDPDEGARLAAGHPDRFPAALELSDVLAPLFDPGLDARARERGIAAGIEAMQYPVSAAAAWIQVGRLREQLGHPRDAAEAYQAAERLDASQANLDSADFEQLLSAAATAGLERTRP